MKDFMYCAGNWTLFFFFTAVLFLSLNFHLSLFTFRQNSSTDGPTETHPLLYWENVFYWLQCLLHDLWIGRLIRLSPIHRLYYIQWNNFSKWWRKEEACPHQVNCTSVLPEDLEPLTIAAPDVQRQKEWASLQWKHPLLQVSDVTKKTVGILFVFLFS